MKRWKDECCRRDVAVAVVVDEKRRIDGVVLIDEGSWLWQHLRGRGRHLWVGGGDAWSLS